MRIYDHFSRFIDKAVKASDFYRLDRVETLYDAASDSEIMDFLSKNGVRTGKSYGHYDEELGGTVYPGEDDSPY